MSLYSYAYVPATAGKAGVRPVGAGGIKAFIAQKKVRLILLLMIQSLIISTSTSIYLASHGRAEAMFEKTTARLEAPKPAGDESVLSAQDEATPTPTAAATPTPAGPTPTPNLGQLLDKPSKKLYRIAIIGDSMVDTMGEVLEYLDQDLKEHYPDTHFVLFNYGIGSQTVADGLDRFDKRFDYKDRHYLSIPDVKPDIIIVGSFGYNPFTPYDRDRHWLTLTALVQKAQSTGAQVYMLAEIAPLRREFGHGPHGVNWDQDTAYTHSGHIVEQLENAVGLSKALHVPILDAYTPSLEPQAKDKIGKKELIDDNDNIHPSIKGQEFTADVIASKIILP